MSRHDTRKRSKKRSGARGRKKLLAFLVVTVVIIFGIVTGTQTYKTYNKNKELEARRERLVQAIEEQQARRAELDDEELYVKTQKYIEEKAKSIGYVYPDEIIFREDD